MNRYRTRKIYYESPFLVQCLTNWSRRATTEIAIEASVAFPEGGGQLGDSGVIEQGNLTCDFQDTQKAIGTGRNVSLAGFPFLVVDTEIRLHLARELNEDWDESVPILVRVDTRRRAMLTRSHSAAHLLYLAMLAVIPDSVERIRGCRIEPDSGRFDLAWDRVSPNQLAQMQAVVADLVSQNMPISVEAHESEPECRAWIAGNNRIACGGTHLLSTGEVGRVTLQRKNKGSGLERIYYKLLDPLPTLQLERYKTTVEEMTQAIGAD